MLNATVDPYIMGLAAAATPCFGFFESGNPTCGDCPVNALCKGRWAILAAEMAEKITAAEAVKAHTKLSPSAPSGLSFDELLSEATGVTPTPSTSAATASPYVATTSAYAPITSAATTTAVTDDPFGDIMWELETGGGKKAKAKAKATPAPASGRSTTTMKAVVESICAACGGQIPAGTLATYIPGKGLVHDGCVS
jgi:hypothetical protein